jgi:curved DNA-binding protein CbpA
MSDSPLSDSPYEVLGVPSDADAAALRLAYRRALRSAHPDTGGDPVRFHAVQRAWSLVGTPEARSAFDRGIRSAVPSPTREA